MEIKVPFITPPTATTSLKEVSAVTPVAKVAPVSEVAPQLQNLTDNQSQWINTALRQLLPHQAPPTRLLTQLLHDFPSLAQNEHLPANLKSLLQNLLQTLPQGSSLNNPQLLAQALQNAGLFLEAKLLQRSKGGSAPLQDDFKANLLKLKAALLEQAASDGKGLSASELKALLTLQENTNGVLSKVLVDQLASLPKADSPKQVWFVEIPFLTQNSSDSLKLEVEKDATHSTSEEQTPCWSVTLTLTPPGLGTFYCKVSFVDNILNTYFRSEDTQTLEIITAHTEQLRTQFEAAGLKPGYIDSQKGTLDRSLQYKLPLQTLFDDKA